MPFGHRSRFRARPAARCCRFGAGFRGRQGVSAAGFPDFPQVFKCRAHLSRRPTGPGDGTGGCAGVRRLRGRTGWRFGDQPVHQFVPALHVHGNDAGPHFRPQMDPGGPRLSGRPEHPAAALLNLVDQVGKHHQRPQHRTQLPVPVAVWQANLLIFRHTCGGQHGNAPVSCPRVPAPCPCLP